MNGVEYNCDLRATPGENNSLWIYAEEREHYAVFDARTKDLKASLFFPAEELFEALAILKKDHADMFDN